MPMRVKVAGNWVDPKSAHVKVAGTWRPVKEIYSKVAGTWRLVWSSATSISNIWNNVYFSGNSTDQFTNPNIYVTFNRNGQLVATESPVYQNIVVGTYASAPLGDAEFQILVNWSIAPSFTSVSGFTAFNTFVDMLPTSSTNFYQIYMEATNVGYGQFTEGTLLVSIRRKANPSEVVSGTFQVNFVKEW